MGDDRAGTPTEVATAPDVRVLVVDGNASLAQVLAELLEQQNGFTAAGVALTGEQALELAQGCELDVVLVDERLDDALPAAVLEGLRLRCPDSVVLLWCYDRVHTVAENADGVLERGMPFGDVVREIRRTLRERRVPTG